MGGVNAREVTIAGNTVVAGATGQVLAFNGFNGLPRHNEVESTRIRMIRRETAETFALAHEQ
jgi:hypothetical protein